MFFTSKRNPLGIFKYFLGKYCKIAQQYDICGRAAREEEIGVQNFAKYFLFCFIDFFGENKAKTGL